MILAMTSAAPTGQFASFTPESERLPTKTFFEAKANHDHPTNYEATN